MAIHGLRRGPARAAWALGLAGLFLWVGLELLGKAENGSASALPEVRALPDFALTAAALSGARPFSRADLAGKPWIADFIYTSCAGPCPLLSTEMARLQRDLPDGVRLVSFTVDPERDSPRRLSLYSARFGADPRRWIFATGRKGVLYSLLRRGFGRAVVEDPAAPEGLRVLHSAEFALVDSRGVIRGWYPVLGEKGVLARLERDARALLKGERD